MPIHTIRIVAAAKEKIKFSFSDFAELIPIQALWISQLMRYGSFRSPSKIVLGYEIRKAVDEKGDGVYATKEFKGKVFSYFHQ